MAGFRTFTQGDTISQVLVQGPKGNLAHNNRLVVSQDWPQYAVQAA